jgi:hypothetical protein
MGSRHGRSPRFLRCAPFVIVARRFSGALIGSASLLPVVRPCPPPVLPGSEFAAKPQDSREHVAFFSSVRPPTWDQQIPRPWRKPDSGMTSMANALTGSAVAASRCSDEQANGPPLHVTASHSGSPASTSAATTEPTDQTELGGGNAAKTDFHRSTSRAVRNRRSARHVSCWARACEAGRAKAACANAS